VDPINEIMSTINNHDLFFSRVIKLIYRYFFVKRRINVLAKHISSYLPKEKPLKGLDVGCGSGELAYLVQQKCPNVQIQGVDIIIRENISTIKIDKFDGLKIPFENNSFDFVILVDVLHHTEKQIELMNECVRLAKEFIIIKDHIYNNWYDRTWLGFRDYIGNRPAKVPLPYKYLSEKDWDILYKKINVSPDSYLEILDIYPKFLSILFPNNLDFMARIRKN